MSISINTLGSTVTIQAAQSVVEAGVGDDVALVGGYDAADTGSNFTSAGDVHVVRSTGEAQNTFGSDSELARAVASITSHNVGDIYAVPVPETISNVESFSGTSGDTLSNAPIFDPRFNPEHSVSAQDTGNSDNVSVNLVYDGNPSDPSGPNEINLNPNTGEWAADENSSYDITYDYGDYDDAIETATQEDVRLVCVLSSNSTHKSFLADDLDNREANINFRRGVTNANPHISVGNISGYTPDVDDYRVIETTPAHATNSLGDVRFCAAYTGLLASQSVNVEGASLYDEVQGVESFCTEYPPVDAGDFSRVVAATRDGEIAVEQCTSSTDNLQDVYAVEIADVVIESLYLAARQYAGGGNLQEDRDDLRGDLFGLLSSFWNQRPALLASGDGTQPFTLNVSADPNDDDITNVTAAIEPAPIMKEVNFDISVGEVATLDGISA